MTEYNPKYAKFRWVLEVPGLEPWIIRNVEMVNGHRWKVDFHYANEMEIGKCPIPITSPSAVDPKDRRFLEGNLKILDEMGGVTRQADFTFLVEDYIPAVELDYREAAYVIGRVILWVLNPLKWS